MAARAQMEQVELEEFNLSGMKSKDFVWKFSKFCMWIQFYVFREGAKRKVSTMDPNFGGYCVPKPLSLKDSNFTGVPQAAQRIKRANIRGLLESYVDQAEAITVTAQLS